MATKKVFFGFMLLIVLISSSIVVLASKDINQGLFVQSISDNLSINLDSPISGENLSNSTNMFNITLSNADSYANCSIFGNWTIWGSKSTINGTNLTNGSYSLVLSDISGLVPDAIYTWAVSCENYDNSSDIKMSSNETFTFVSDSIPDVPEIFDAIITKTSISPTYYENETFQFFINVTNNGTLNITDMIVNDTFNSGEMNFTSSTCSLYQNDTANGWLTINLSACFGSVLTENQSTQFSINFSYVSGSLPLNTTNTVVANIIGSNGSLITRMDNATIQINETILLDTINPNVTLLSPANLLETTNQTQIFIAATSDETALDSCSLYLDAVLNQTNSTPSVNTTFLLNLSVGMHAWNVSCNDTSGNINVTDARTITINSTPDTTKPTVLLSSPSDGYATANQNITFSATTNDDIALDVCILYFDAIVNQTNSLPAMAGATNFFVTNILEGSHTWNVSCNDTSGNLNITNSRSLTINLSLVDNTDPITNISLIGTLGDNSWYVSDVTINFSVVEDNFNRTEYNINSGGWINFTAPFNLTNGANNTIEYRSIDNTGNVEVTKIKYVAIDKTAPVVSVPLTSLPVNPQRAIDNFSIYTTVTGGVNGTFSITYPNRSVANYVYNMSGNIYFYNFSAQSQYGNYKINSLIRDLAGNVLNQSYNVSIVEYTNLQNLNGSENETISIDNRSLVNVTVDIELNQTLSAGSLNITLYGDSPESSSLTDAVKYYVFEEDSNLNASLRWVTIKLYYTDEEIMGISDGTFDMYWFNESSGSWVELVDTMDFVDSEGVDLTNNYVWANVSHFSTYSFTGVRRACSDNVALSQFGCYYPYPNGVLYTSGYICSGSYSATACDSGSSTDDSSSSTSTNDRRSTPVWYSEPSDEETTTNTNAVKDNGYTVNESDPFFTADDTPYLSEDDEETDYSDWNQEENKIKTIKGGVDEGQIWLWTFIIAGVFVAIGFYITHDHIILDKKGKKLDKK